MLFRSKKDNNEVEMDENVDSNKNDKYHLDTSDITILIFLNDDFVGGEFEYINEEKKPIKIQIPDLVISIGYLLLMMKVILIYFLFS